MTTLRQERTGLTGRGASLAVCAPPGCHTRPPHRAPGAAVVPVPVPVLVPADPPPSPPFVWRLRQQQHSPDSGSARVSTAPNHLERCLAPCHGYSHFSFSRPPWLGMNIYAGVLINIQPASTADINYANLIPCKLKFVIPSLCFLVQFPAQRRVLLFLSLMALLKCVVSTMIVKPMRRFPWLGNFSLWCSWAFANPTDDTGSVAARRRNLPLKLLARGGKKPVTRRQGF